MPNAAPQAAHASYLRPHRPGDIGWVIHRHGVIYAREYGFDEKFEGLVAEIGAQFLKHFNPAREYCWIAEREGAVVGSLFLVEESAEVAKLRLFYIEPEMRGQGLGKHMLQTAIDFARAHGYSQLTLWTNHILTTARHLYEQAGFELIKQEPHQHFGEGLIGQYWELGLK